MFFVFGTIAGHDGSLINAHVGLTPDDAQCVARLLRRVRFPRSAMAVYEFSLNVGP